MKTERGRFTFAWDQMGDVVFDGRAVYPILTTLMTHKGEYYWDVEGRQGTLLHTVKQDKLMTGSQLRNYAQEGGQQFIAEGQISFFDAQSRRCSSGCWELTLCWRVKSDPKLVGEQVRV